MARVVALHEIELHADASPADFEQSAQEFLTLGGAPAGSTYSILKGDRGTRTGKYVLMIEFESAADRDRWFPGVDLPLAPEAQAYFDRMMSELGTFLAPTPDTGNVWTDYVKVAP